MKLCSVSFILSVIAIQFLHLSTIVNGLQRAMDSCNSTLPLQDLALDASLLQCVEVWTDQNYILRYAKTVENTWSFILSTPDSSAYIAIGFSANGRMVGSSAIVGWITSDGESGDAKQYLLGGMSPSDVIPDQGELKILNGSLMIESVSSRLYMSFQLMAELPRENLLYAMGPADFFPSSPEFRLREHQFMTTTTINYITGPATTGPTMSPGLATTGAAKTPLSPAPSPSSAYGLSPSLLFFVISLVAFKFY
ncbi:cytochrome b561 and DOMON domain-containing protein At3g07570-like [Raphanus sativus]|uniref:Cytochrome b561 and DOMON domain-containing protein At3g07570-like n=1 Tax=Raphanus sativus TaxID=3726 RepID=A0A9W3BYT4_RAPSA|nr:cytochrome b561 and DOMON domain-containing protein At3g07570-like [Raphanus sativus]